MIEDFQRKTICVVEFSCPLECNIVEKEQEKRQKYKDLIFELRKRNPQKKVILVPVIIGVLGGVKASVRDGISSIPGCEGSQDQLLRRIQQQVVLGSLHLLRGHEVAFT